MVGSMHYFCNPVYFNWIIIAVGQKSPPLFGPGKGKEESSSLTDAWPSVCLSSNGVLKETNLKFFCRPPFLHFYHPSTAVNDRVR
jgi:hypothetical protein